MFHYKKRLGQNFLKDEQIITCLVAAAAPTARDIVLEPGAGTGAVTKEIAKQVKRVYAVEFDRDLITELKQAVPENTETLNQDVLDLDFPTLQPPPTIIIGSIPYQITSPLIHKIIHWAWGEGADKRPPNLRAISLLIQKEVALKITAPPPKATYLSNLVSLLGKAEIIQTVPPEAFYPEPKVQSAILKITTGKIVDWQISTLIKFENFLHHGFRHPRKMLNKTFDNETLQACNAHPSQRPGNLTINQWLCLYRNWG